MRRQKRAGSALQGLRHGEPEARGSGIGGLSEVVDDVSPPTREHPTKPQVAEEPRGSSRLPYGILYIVLCGFLSVQVLNVVTSPLPSHGIVLGLGLASVVPVFGLQLAHSSPRAARWPAKTRLVTLTAQALLTYLPLLALGKEWGAMAGLLAGSILLLVTGPLAWVLFALVIASMIVELSLRGLGAASVAYLVVATVDTGLVVWGLSRLTAIRQVHAAREELAQLAVIRERMRFARDLHDLLSYSLSAITLKAELTRHLARDNPRRARDELSEVIDIARQALADVRVVSRGYRNFSLMKEASSIRSLLETAGIDVSVMISCGALGEEVDTVLATVLREGVTNLLRHSTAKHCSIDADQVGENVRLTIENDGVQRSRTVGRRGGGLENLSARLAAIGGKLTTGIAANGHFELLAEAPVSDTAAGASPVQDTRPEDLLT